MKRKLLYFGMLLIISSILTGCSSAHRYDEDGKKHFADGNYEEAAINFKKAIEYNPNRTEYYIDYAMSFIMLGKYEEAIAQFDSVYQEKEILILKENNKRILRGKGIAFYHMQQYQNAVELFDLALNLNVLSDLNMDILFYKGSALMMMGSYEEAETVFSEILKLDPKNEEAYNSRAYLNRVAGNYEKSLEDYDTVISLNVNHYDYYFGKYFLLIDMGNKGEAAEILRQAADIEVKTNEDQFNRAKLDYFSKEYDTALAKFNECLSNGFSEAYFYIGEIYRQKKDYDSAVYNYKLFLEEGTNLTSTVYNQIASCLMKQGKYKEAITYIESGLAYLQADTWKTLKKNEIISYEKLGMFDEAKDKLKEYLDHYPDDMNASRELQFLQNQLR